MSAAIVGGITAAGVTAAAAAAGAGAAIYSAVKKPGSAGSGSSSSEEQASTKKTSIVGPSSTLERTSGQQLRTSLSPEALSMLQGLVMGGDYSKQAAISDSRDAVTAGIQEVMQKYMPTIAANEKGSGMMGDSMTQILARQTAVQAGVQGAAVKMNAISNYGNNLSNFFQNLIAGSPQNTYTNQDVQTTNSGYTTTEEGTSTGETKGTTTQPMAQTVGQIADAAGKLSSAFKGDSGSVTPIDTTVGKNQLKTTPTASNANVPVAASSSSGSSVLCTAYYDLGFMDRDTWMADELYGAALIKTDKRFLAWYHSWARSLVPVVYNNPTFAFLLWHGIVKHWAIHMATGKSAWGKAIEGLARAVYNLRKAGV